LVSQPVTISVVDNDFGFLAVIDPTTVTTLGLLQPKHGTVSVNTDGTILYIPDPGFSGSDTFDYNVCSTPSPIVCDIAMVVVKISTCPSNGNQNVLSGQVFIDRNKDALNNDGGLGLPGVKVYLYTDGDCSGIVNSNELTDSVTVDASGFYQFTKYPEKIVEDNFDGPAGTRTCANGTDGDSPWSSDWTDINDPSTGFCNTTQLPANTDVEIMKDGAFSYGIRLKDHDVSARRSVNLNGALKSFLTFSYRRKSATLTAGENILVQASTNGSAFTTVYTIAGNGTADANYVTVYNQDITAYASTTTAIRFLTNSSVDDADTIYIDNVSIRYLKYPQCYITRIDPASVPADYTTTTAAQKAVTITSGGTCTSQFDFGFAKPNVTVSGTLLNDQNGLVDGQVNGPAIGSPGGATIYAYLADLSGKVVIKTTVNSGNGTYAFSLAEVNTEYTLILSTYNVALGSNAPSATGCPATWVPVGDAYGVANVAGSGNNTAVAVKTAYINVTDVNFGIQRLPNSDNHITSINQPTVNQYITLNGQGMNPPVLSGLDPEDCSAGCVLTSRSVIIDTVPNNAELYYTGLLVTNAQMINNFNPDLLQVRVTAATLGSNSVQFRYSYVDAALMKDPSPASYALMWFIPLPVDGLIAQANLSGTVTTVKWLTLSEQNTDHFLLERSLDNIRFIAIGKPVDAAKNSISKQEYQQQDNISSLMQNPVVYYRVKLIDIDGRVKYSNVVAVRLNGVVGITAWPNPFVTSITVNISTIQNTELTIRLVDMAGRTVLTNNQQASRGISQVTLSGLDKLSKGVYLLDVTDRVSGNKTVHKFIKE
jgi:hypothetical protein